VEPGNEIRWFILHEVECLLQKYRILSDYQINPVKPSSFVLKKKAVWKDFFSFTKRERVTILVLIVLVLGVQVIIWTSDRWAVFLPEEWHGRYKREKAVRAFADSMAEVRRSGKGNNSWQKQKNYSVSVKLAAFDPNSADSLTLLRLGLKPYVVRNILKYRSKGGRFRKAAELERIYGMDADAYARLEPYIRFSSSKENEDTDEREGYSEKANNGSKEQSEAGAFDADGSFLADRAVTPAVSGSVSPHRMDLNRADTSQLQQIKGVGKITAERIAKYRKQLGGFYDLKQLDEVRGIYPETKERLKSMLKINPEDIVPIFVNKVSLERLREHPYISFWQAKVLVELRKARGSIRSLDELSQFKEFKPEDLERLKWYISFK
jgi:competence ComEA-like helix-hairpin-helix protein